MKRNSDKANTQEINSFNDLRERKRQVQKEIATAANNVTKSTEQLLEEGAKVVAVGFVAFLVSRLLNVFMGRGRKPSTHVSAMAFESEREKPKDEGSAPQSEQRGDPAETTQEQMNGQHSTLDTARIWLETISGGLEAARIIIDQIAEVQDQVKEKKERGNTEPAEEHTTDPSNAT